MMKAALNKFNKVDKVLLINNINLNTNKLTYPNKNNKDNTINLISISNNNVNIVGLLLVKSRLYKILFIEMLTNLNVNYINNKMYHRLKSSFHFYCLELLFLRNRFFPQFSNFLKNETIFNASLGIVSNYFSKSKSFLRSKAAYLMLAVYIRRMLTSINLLNINLKVKGIPLHLSSILKSILTQSNVIYQNPFKDNVFINEAKNTQYFLINFSYIIFTNNKSFSLNKNKKKGRLKRKIMKRVISNNNILD